MSDHLELRALPGSERAAAPGLRAATALDPATPVQATVVLRRRAPLDVAALTQHLTAAELAEQHGADPADVDLVTSTLTGLGITVLTSDAASRRVRIEGTAGTLGTVFGTTLEQAESRDGSHRHRTGGLSVPAALDGVVTAVLGLDDRAQARARTALPRAAAQVSYTPPQLGTVYDFPAGTDGTGQTVAVVELGGGFGQADLDAYFTGLGLTTPTITSVGVDGATNVPGADPQGADGEVLLDVEVVGALVPGATVVVYFAPNSDDGFVDAVSEAAHASPAPVSISISWGQSEDEWTAQGRTALDDAMADACAVGATVTVAAGDDGSTDRAADGKAHVDFPAASPHALACGGTQLHADPATGKVRTETVWDNGVGKGATGGGVSGAFGLPTWQEGVGVPDAAGTGKPGRGVPDVAGVADPQTGYQVRVDGTDLVIGGTSAVAPLWAALLARLAQATGTRFGLVQPRLYATATTGHVPPGFRDITKGTNGAYSAGPGWDACTGLGVPVGTALLAVLSEAVGDGHPS